jgi:serine/threonine protein kinase
VPFAIAVRIALDLAAALQRIHGRRPPEQQVHRDVCPENVVITRDGEVQLLDFGIARGRTVEHQPYQSPEQWRHEAMDGRSDLFSLGIVVYELVTLRKPFASAADLVVGAYNTPATIVADTPSPLSSVIARCLQPVPALRPANASDLRRDLYAIVTRAGWTAADMDLSAWVEDLFHRRPAPPAAAAAKTPRHRVGVIAVAFALTVAAALIALALLR